MKNANIERLQRLWDALLDPSGSTGNSDRVQDDHPESGLLGEYAITLVEQRWEDILREYGEVDAHVISCRECLEDVVTIIETAESVDDSSRDETPVPQALVDEVLRRALPSLNVIEEYSPDAK